MIKVVKSENLIAEILAAPRNWKGIIVHHTATVAWPWVARISRRPRPKLYGETIDKMHRRRGWKGMGYHLLINPGGEIEIGDRWPRQADGAHCRGFNDHLGVAFVGNFNKHRPTAQQLETWKQIRNLFSGLEVLPHVAKGKTCCPGRNINLRYWFKKIDF